MHLTMPRTSMPKTTVRLGGRSYVQTLETTWRTSGVQAPLSQCSASSEPLQVYSGGAPIALATPEALAPTRKSDSIVKSAG